MRLSMASMHVRLLPILLGQVLGLACGVVGVRVTTQLVPPSVFGRYSLFLTFTSVGMWVIYAGMIKFTARHWAAAPDKDALRRDLTRGVRRKFPSLALVCLVGTFVTGEPQWPWIYAVLFVTAVLLSTAQLAQTALQAARQHWRDCATISAGAATRSFVPPLMYTAMGGSALALYGGYCLHALVFAAAGWWMLRGHLRSAEVGPESAPLLTTVYEGPLFVVLAIVGWAGLGLTRWVSAYFFGIETTGYFVLASNIAMLVPSVLGTIFLQYFQPGFFAAASEDQAARRQLARHVDRVAMVHAALALTGLCALRAVAPLLVGPLIHETYRPTLPLMIPAGCATLALTTGYFYQSLLLAGKCERAIGYVELSAAAVLVTGTIAFALAGEAWFFRWLLVTPIVPWIVNRPLARRYYFMPASADGSATARKGTYA